MPLVDTGLVVRYFSDEAASGTGPTDLLDASGNGYHLPITYDTDMSYTEVSGNRGLEITATATDARANKAVVASDLIDSIEGGTKYTLELVLRVDSVTASHSRFFGIHDRVGGDYDLGLKASSTSLYWAQFGGFDAKAVLDLSTRSVVHVVFDTTQATDVDRVKFYVDNVQKTTTEISGISLNATLNISHGSVDLIFANRQSGANFGRSFDGEGFYEALYEVAMSSADRTTNFNILTSDDDAPGAGPTTLNAPVASVSVTTPAMTVSPGAVSVAAPKADVSVTTPAATVVSPITLSAPVASVSCTTPGATVSPGPATPAAPVASVSVTTPAMSVAAPVTLSAPKADVSVTTPAATLSPGPVTPSAPIATVTCSTPAMTPLPGATTPAAPVASVTVTTPGMTISVGGSPQTINAPVATVTVTTPTATPVPGAVTVSAPKADVSVTTPAMGITNGVTLGAPVSVVTVTTPAPSVIPGLSAPTAPVANVSVTTPAVGILTGAITLIAPLASLTVATPAMVLVITAAGISIALRMVADHTGYRYRATDRTDYLYRATDRTDYLLRSTDRSGP